MSHPFEPFGSQKLDDDDAKVIDDLVKEVNAPADIKGGIEPVTVPAKVKPRNITRLQTATVLFSGGAEPQRLLGEDLNRLTCRIRVLSSADPITYNDYVIINDQQGMIAGRTLGSNITAHSGANIDLDGHTGPVWVIPGSGITASIEVTAYGITSIEEKYGDISE